MLLLYECKWWRLINWQFIKDSIMWFIAIIIWRWFIYGRPMSTIQEPGILEHHIQLLKYFKHSFCSYSGKYCFHFCINLWCPLAVQWMFNFIINRNKLSERDFILCINTSWFCNYWALKTSVVNIYLIKFRAI